MNSKERVIAAFEHRKPDRVPCWCGASEEFWKKAKQQLALDDEQLRLRFRDDFRRVHAKYIGPEFELSPQATSRTIFGVERQGLGYGQPISHPLIDASLKDVNNYLWPDPNWIDVSNIKADAQAYNGDFAILGGDWSPFWHDAIDLLGIENLFIKMYTDPEIVDAVFQHLVDYYFAVSEKVFDAAANAVDVFFIGNDFGSQIGPLISPQLFTRFIQPHLRRLIDLGHSYNLKVQLHCCGGFAPLIPMMIEDGLDGLHAVQPDCIGMDLRSLKEQFGDRILFNGAVDSHNVLIDGTPDFVRKKTREVLDIMMPGSGFIAGASHDTILEETPVENIIAMFDTIYEYGEYS